MTQRLNPFSGRQFLDVAAPYAGAKLFAYLAGTTTKATLTKDAAGLSNHANPIILNTKGEPADGAGSSQAMWQTEGQDIKLVLAPSTDTDPPVSAISTWDNLQGINDAVEVAPSEWITGTTPTFVSGTQFTLENDQSTVYHVGRRLKTTNSSGFIYSTITAVAYTSLTTVTVENDSGALDSGLSVVQYALLSAVNNTIPGGIHEAATTYAGISTHTAQVRWAKGADIASANALVLGTDGNYFDVTGVTPITSIGTVGIGTIIKLHFDAALTLTHHATDLILPDAVNITTAAGDEAEIIEYATGDWILTNYLYATTPKIQTADLEQTGGSEAVTQATIRDAAVGQAQLKSTTASQSVTVLSSSTNSIDPTGATYTLGWFVGTDGAIGDLRVCSHGGTYVARVAVENTIASNREFYLYSRYVQASPPWNLGNGDISLFVMAKINKTTKEVLATEIAPDPHWAYHGPHDLHPHYGKLQKAAGLWGKNIKDIISGADPSMTREDYFSRLKRMKNLYDDKDLYEKALSADFTMDEKNKDMLSCPHSFGVIGPDEQVIMIDPVGSITDELGIMHEQMGQTNHEGGSITELLHDGYIVLGDALDANTPPGIVAVSARWK